MPWRHGLNKRQDEEQQASAMVEGGPRDPSYKVVITPSLRHGYKGCMEHSSFQFPWEFSYFLLELLYNPSKPYEKPMVGWMGITRDIHPRK